MAQALLTGKACETYKARTVLSFRNVFGHSHAVVFFPSQKAPNVMLGNGYEGDLIKAASLDTRIIGTGMSCLLGTTTRSVF